MPLKLEEPMFSPVVTSIDQVIKFGEVDKKYLTNQTNDSNCK